jgi:GntR family transcriptional regulator, histidine utilization repressor
MPEDVPVRSQIAPSLHVRILGDLEDRILSSAWPPGHRIPSELEIAESYQCSRMTVNKVLTQLAHAGLVERRRKAGSFVRRPYSQSAVLEIKDIKAEVLEQGQPYRYEITSMRKRRRRGDDRALLGLAGGGAVLDLTCLHFAGLRPFCLEKRLINLDAVPEAATERFEDQAPGAWLMTRVPWTGAEHCIRAEAADAQTSARLGIRPGAACLVIERRTSWTEQPITFVRLTYPGGTHELVARFAPSQA